MTVDWMVLFGIVLTVASVWMFVRMSRDKDSKFDFAEMFLDEDGRMSMSKFGAFVGIMAATWGFIAYAASRGLSDTVFLGYMSILIIGKIATELVAAKKVEASDKARMGIVDPLPAAAPSQITIQTAAAVPSASPAADTLARGSPEKPLHVEIEDAKPKPTAGRRPLGKRGGPTKG